MTAARLRWKHINADAEFGGTLLVAALFGSIMSFFGGMLVVNESHYLIDGITVDARVIDKSIAARPAPVIVALIAHAGGRRGPVFRVRYEFADTAGQVHNGSDGIDEAEWRRLAPGATIRIEYLRSNPEWNRPLRPIWLLLLGTGLSIGGVAALLGGFLFLRSRLRTINEQVRLTLIGKPVLGLIPIVQRHKPSKGAAFLVVNYAYSVTGPNGPELHGGSFRCSDRRPTPWEDGQPILVLVDETDPARHAPDRFHVREAELATLLQTPAETPRMDH
jgi:hypothetical protein